jgi:hypothetical protein
MTVPLWVVALVLATLAPFAAKALAASFERWSRERSRQILMRAQSSEGAIDDTSRSV